MVASADGEKVVMVSCFISMEFMYAPLACIYQAVYNSWKSGI